MGAFTRPFPSPAEGCTQASHIPKSWFAGRHGLGTFGINRQITVHPVVYVPPPWSPWLLSLPTKLSMRP